MKKYDGHPKHAFQFNNKKNETENGIFFFKIKMVLVPGHIFISHFFKKILQSLTVPSPARELLSKTNLLVLLSCFLSCMSVQGSVEGHSFFML